MVRWAGGGSQHREEGGPAPGAPGRRSADGGRDGCQPALSPVRNCGQHGLEGPATRSEPVANADRRAWIHKTFDKPLGLQLTQSLGEDAVTDAWDAGK